jgi:acetyl-CoA C-acetyltransferase
VNAYIIDGVYTPRASVKKGLSAYSSVHPQELVVACLKALHDRQEQIFDRIDSAYIGSVSQVNDQGANLARNAILAAGLPHTISAATIDMCCGSGLQAINLAAASVVSGAESLVLAGGVESMSRVKMGSDGGGMDGNNLALREKIFQPPQGISADFIATTQGIGRNQLDEYSLQSQKKATSALAQGFFNPSYAFVPGPDNNPLLLHEDHIRPEATLEGLTALAPAFAKIGAELTAMGVIGANKPIPVINHLHTAGSSSGIADGASLLLVAGDSFIEESGIKPRAKILATAARGSDPVSMLTGPADCCLAALKRVGLTANDVDLWEINEAFAIVPIQTMARLNIGPEQVNVWGGAIALGHPLGATGGILLTSLISALEQRNLSIGCAVLCVAGGQSVATVVQRVAH